MVFYIKFRVDLSEYVHAKFTLEIPQVNQPVCQELSQGHNLGDDFSDIQFIEDRIKRFNDDYIPITMPDELKLITAPKYYKPQKE
jgi:hypothetical protein